MADAVRGVPRARLSKRPLRRPCRAGPGSRRRGTAARTASASRRSPRPSPPRAPCRARSPRCGRRRSLASMTLWVTTSIVPPCSACCSTSRSPSSAVRTGSRPESGSSQRTMPGSQHERARQAGALAHPARELVGHPRRRRRRGRRCARCSVDDLADLVLVEVGVLAQREGDVVVDVHRAEQRAVLEHHADLARAGRAARSGSSGSASGRGSARRRRPGASAR